MERDRTSIGLTDESRKFLQDIEGKGWFPTKQDIGRFCLAYAIRVKVPDGASPGTETQWTYDLFDRSGEILALVSALYPDCKTPVRLMEHLVNEGLQLVHKRIEEGASPAQLMGQG